MLWEKWSMMVEMAGENLAVDQSQILQHAPQHTMIGVIVWDILCMFAVPYRAGVVVRKFRQRRFA
jgi:hypothetical protein